MRKLNILIVLIGITWGVLAQENKRTLTFDDILKWNRITEKVISNDGNYLAYKTEPWKGDAVLKIISKTGNEIEEVEGGSKVQITEDSRFVIFRIEPKKEEVRQLKLKKTKKEDMPMNMLGIYNLRSSNLKTIARLKSIKVPEKWNGWIAYQTKSVYIKDTTSVKKDKNKSKKSKIKKESDDNGYALMIENLESGEIIKVPFVTDYVLAEENEAIAFVSAGDKDFEPGIYYYDLKSNEQTTIINAKGDYKQLSLNKDGAKLAVLADTTSNKKKSYNLLMWTKSEGLKELVNNSNASISDGWEISKNGKIKFSESSSRIFFGVASIRPEKDTTKLDEEMPELDIWVWNEPRLHTEQLNSKKDDLKKSYLAVFHLNQNKMVQLESESHTGISLIDKGDGDKVVAWSRLPYAVQSMWEGGPYRNDLYLVDINTGSAKMIKRNLRARPQVSPEGKYLYWYNPEDTSWNTYNINTENEYKVTKLEIIQCANELNDRPNLSSSYRNAGWLKNDEAFLVYDRFDVWKVDPENKTNPINITVNGKQKSISYRYINFDRKRGEDDKGIDPSKPFYLNGHNEITRADGYYRISPAKSGVPVKLIEGNFNLGTPIKAKKKDAFVFTKETFEQFPDLLITENEFKKYKKLSNANPQQKDFHWGTIELYSWTSLDGRKLEGLVAKPANFDPNKKYPMIVNFYEKYSQGLFNHRTPQAHRSTIDYHYYTSNGYVVFNPDIYYKTGYPGEDAFNCVMPGITQLVSEGFIDKERIAAQGHSWGGYQVAYLATRTNLFAAIESGAPVVNMFSAYGGIRLNSGRNRSSQYEHTQSRIGKSIWESPLRYIENSPIFTADKINTPMLIMHNEDDGAVPFGQGVEFFIAMRRMGKKAWLLNYNEANHWPLRIPDKYDFQVRMAQFFDHYLKDKPMPQWMKEGVPAVDKGFDMGYDLVK